MTSDVETTKCNLCGEGEFIEIRDIETELLRLDTTPYRVTSCLSCGLWFMNPRPTWDELKKVYEEEYVDCELYDMETVNRWRVKNVYPSKIENLRQVQPAGRLLDVGAGVGGFLSLARDAGYDIQGCEPSKSESDLALKRYGIELLNCDLESCAFEEKSFDVIHMHHVLEHVPDPSKTLELVSCLLRPDGVFYFEVPNDLRSSVFYYMRLKHMLFSRHSFQRPSLHHLYFFDFDTISAYIEKAGFEIIFIRGRYSEVSFRSSLVKKIIKLLTMSQRLSPAIEVLCKKVH
jgi:2-polyprenyl-3-methyl-5-hydroxy-6-metoxy-1,4-benzoquinol methylase